MNSADDISSIFTYCNNNTSKESWYEFYCKWALMWSLQNEYTPTLNNSQRDRDEHTVRSIDNTYGNEWSVYK